MGLPHQTGQSSLKFLLCNLVQNIWRSFEFFSWHIDLQRLLICICSASTSCAAYMLRVARKYSPIGTIIRKISQAPKFVIRTLRNGRHDWAPPDVSDDHHLSMDDSRLIEVPRIDYITLSIGYQMTMAAFRKTQSQRKSRNHNLSSMRPPPMASHLSPIGHECCSHRSRVTQII